MPKKKGDKGGNPNPPTPPGFVAQMKVRSDDDPYRNVPLGRNLQVRMYQPVIDALEELTSAERSVWLRRVVTEAAIHELGVKLEL